jgi:hypothetical protein
VRRRHSLGTNQPVAAHAACALIYARLIKSDVRLLCRRNFLSQQRQNRYAAHEADDEWLSINQLHRAAADNESRVFFAADGVLNKLRKSRFCGVRELGDAYFAFNRSKNNCGNNSGRARDAARELSRKGWGRTSVAIIIAPPPRNALGMKQSQRATKLRRPLRRRD